MMHRRTAIKSALLLLPLTVPLANAGAGAGPVDAGTPAEVSSSLPQALRAGSARLRFWGFNVYDARLWVSPGFKASTFEQYPFALELKYLRSLSGRDIAQKSLDEIRRAHTISEQQAQQWLAAMQKIFPDVHQGDHITGVHRPGVGARFWFNGKLRGEINDAQFSNFFFGIWLAQTTSQPSLRTQLLTHTAH